MEPAGRNIVITGAAGGIGSALAERFLAEGAARIALLDRDATRLEALAARLGASERIVPVAVDLADQASLDAACAEVAGALGKVHILVNNAGVVLRGVPVAQIAPETWRWVFDTNFFGAVGMVRALLPGMLRHGEGGHIVNMASIAGFVVGNRRTGAYAASKFALVAYTEALAADLQGSGLGVSLIAPAAVSTRLYDNSAAARAAPPLAGAMNETPRDIADGMDTETVACHVVDAIRAGRLFTMTHPETRAWIEQRHESILAAFGGGRPFSDKDEVKER